jgi:hypothetical protein
MEVIQVRVEPGAIPLEVVRDEFKKWLRSEAIDPETVDFKVSHAIHLAMIDGELRQIQTTVLELPDGQRFEWIPRSSDAGHSTGSSDSDTGSRPPRKGDSK